MPELEKHQRQLATVNQELIGALEKQDTLGAIELARDFCQNIHVDYSSWPGVTPHPDRGEQIRKSKRLLAGFPDGIVELDNLRWSAFKAKLDLLASLASEDLPDAVACIIEFTRLRYTTWSSAALEELPSLFGYINSLRYLDDAKSRAALPAQITDERLTTIVSEFLTQHVGSGDQKVRRPGVTGFDGPLKTCPIVHSKGVGMRYFAVSAAEYLWMNVIVSNYIQREAH